MSKRKLAKTSKHACSPKIAAQAQRNKQDIVRSAKDTLLRSVTSGPIEPLAELQHEPPQTLIVPKPPIEDRTGILEEAIGQMMRDNRSRERPDYSFAMPNMLAYQTKLLEMTQANMRLAVEFSQRLARVRTPYEFFDVMLEFTYRRFYLITKLL